MRRKGDFLFYIILLFLVVSTLVILWMKYTPVKALTINSLTVDKIVCNRGEEICYTINAEKFIDVPANITIEMSNGETILIMNYEGHMPPGLLIRKRCFIVPYHVFPSKYRIRWTGMFSVNTFQYVRVSELSNEFLVR